jgi:hypothetical protein
LPARRRACGRRRWLECAIGQAVKSAHMIENLAWAGNAPALRSPRQFAAIVKADLLLRGPVVKASAFIADD